MSFADEEVVYLRSQRLAHLATVATDGQPDVVPVFYHYDGTYVHVGGLTPARTRKFRNVKAGNIKVAVVIDDLPSTNPWSPRFLRIYGTAEIVERQSESGPAPYMLITPAISWSFNLDGQAFSHSKPFVARRTLHEPPRAQ